MTWLTPALSPRAWGPDALPDSRPVLALVDLEAPFESVLRRAAAAAATLNAPLRVAVLHPRPAFTTDPSIAARIARRSGVEYRQAVALAGDIARDNGLGDVSLDPVPYARLPLGDPVRRARRAAAIQRRRTAAQLVLAADHLNVPDGA